MMRRDGGRVYLDLSDDEWGNLQVVLGYALGASFRADPEIWAGVMRIMNAIHQGDETFSFFEVPPE